MNGNICKSLADISNTKEGIIQLYGLGFLSKNFGFLPTPPIILFSVFEVEEGIEKLP